MLACLTRGLFAAAALLTLAFPVDQARAAFVDCDAGESIRTALSTGETSVRFTGTCNESVVIGNDNVVIRGGSGNPANDVINGRLDIFAAQGVFIQSLTVTGDSVFVLDGAQATFTNVTVTETQFGFFVIRGSNVIIQNSTLTPALVDDANLSCGPLCIGDNSYARITNSTITGNTSDPNIGGALIAFRDASILLRGTNTIVNTGSAPALGVFFASSLRQDNLSGDQAAQIDGGVFVQGSSYVDLRTAAVTGDSEVDLHSVLRLGSTGFGGNPALVTVDGDISASRDSAIAVESPEVTINGDITCADRESSLSGKFLGTGKVKCSGFGTKSDD